MNNILRVRVCSEQLILIDGPASIVTPKNMGDAVALHLSQIDLAKIDAAGEKHVRIEIRYYEGIKLS